jgi:hypothetical protein
MQESYMKKLLLIGLLLSSFLIIAMEKAVVTVPERKAKGFVTIIKEFPFDITKNGRYALPKGEEIKVLDVFDGKKALNTERLQGCITTHRNVTWVQLNLKGCIIDCKNYFFSFIALSQATRQDVDIEIYNGTIKNASCYAAMYVVFNSIVKAHHLRFENCQLPFFISPDFRSWDIVVINDGEDKSKEWNPSI